MTLPATRRVPVTKANIVRAVAAAREAGMVVGSVTITTALDGTVTLTVNAPLATPAPQPQTPLASDDWEVEA